MKLHLKYQVKLANGRTEILEVTSEPQDKDAFEADLKEIYGDRNVKEVS